MSPPFNHIITHSCLVGYYLIKEMLENGCEINQNLVFNATQKMAKMFDLFALCFAMLFCDDKISPLFYYLVVQMKKPEKHATKRR